MEIGSLVSVEMGSLESPVDSVLGSLEASDVLPEEDSLEGAGSLEETGAVPQETKAKAAITKRRRFILVS